MRSLSLLALPFASAVLGPVLSAQTWVRRTLDLGPTYLGGAGINVETIAAFDPGRSRYVARLLGAGTWEWDGSSWGLRATGADFVAARFIAMAYDGRGILVFGGTGNTASPSPNETWRWDGQAWRQLQSPASPSARYWSAMAYDSGRDRLVLFGGWASGSLGDTWEWDGSTWTQRAVAGPPARSRHAMTYDATRGRVLLCGGWTGGYIGTPVHDTWEWDGTSWQQLATDGALTEGSLAFDVDRGRAVLAGISGTVATLEWDGVAWTQQMPAHPPTGFAVNLAFDAVRRRVVAMTAIGLEAWDGNDWRPVQDVGSPIRQTAPALIATDSELLLLGQRGYPAPGTAQDAGLSAWDGQRWRTLPNASLPVGELLVASATYDAARRRVVVFGGLGRNVFLGGTWEWSASTGWQQLAPALAPTARWDHGMAFDAAHGRVVLYGGQDSSGPRDDTWTFDGTTWTAHSVAVHPGPRKNHKMEYDAHRQRVVLFGGQYGDNATWEWDGSAWAASAPTSPTYAAASWYDADRQRVATVTRNGGIAGLLVAVHEWDGQTWTPRDPVPNGALALLALAAAFDANHGRAVVAANGAAISFEETWIVGETVAAAAMPRGVGCAAQVAPRLLGFGRPTIGRTSFRLELELAVPAAPTAFVFGVQPANIPLGQGCTLLVDPAWVALIVATVLDGRGYGAVALPIPASPHLAGAELHAQAFVIDASAPFAGLALSNGLRCVVGD